MNEWVTDHPVTTLDAADPTLAAIQRFPVKSLDPERCERATLTTAGALAGDRRWAVLDHPPGAPVDLASADVGGSGDFYNGKATDAVHRIRSWFERPGSTATATSHGAAGKPGDADVAEGEPVDADAAEGEPADTDVADGEEGDRGPAVWLATQAAVADYRASAGESAPERPPAGGPAADPPRPRWARPDGPGERFDLLAPDGTAPNQATTEQPSPERQARAHADVDAWLAEYARRPLSVRYHDAGQHDDRTHHGPTVISRATLREVAAWFDWSLESARRRFRANLEIAGVPPFWEDQLFADAGEVVPFAIGEATLLGRNPCQRCVVPGRDPWTGAATADFRERFVERREQTLPDWTPCERFDHPYRLMVNTHVLAPSDGATIAVGDAIERQAPRPDRS